MNLHNLIKPLVLRSIRFIMHSRDRIPILSDSANIGIYLTASLYGSKILSDLNDPSAYIEFLRNCSKHTTYGVRFIKSKSSDQHNISSKRFISLIECLRNGVPAIPVQVAHDLGFYADRCYGNFQPIEGQNWAGDVGLMFKILSSTGDRCRLLATIVRFIRPISCLEVGTGFGMSAMMILSALVANEENGYLTTLEGGEPQFSFAREMLTKHFGTKVACHKGLIKDELPKLIKSLNNIDFLFHDAGHSREDLINDFTMVESTLSSGAVVLIDDIRWEDPRFYSGTANCYKGWMHIVGHPRIRQAVEINGTLGLLLLE